MDKTEFIGRYRERIRVRLDWYALGGEEWTVRTVRLALPQDLPKLWTPWYANAASGPPPSDPQAWPLSVEHAAANRARLGANQNTLDRHMAEWREDQIIEAPALALARERFLLLDRNHHVVAGALLLRPATLMLHALVGPPGAKMLLDLPRLE